MRRFWGRSIINSLAKLFGYEYSLVLIITAMVSFLGGGTTAAWGSGFALMQQGTAAMAQGNAFVAEASDASAIFYNPAGLNQLKGVQFYQGSFLNHPDREYSGLGQDCQTNHRWYKSMTAYLAVPVHHRVALGLGFFSPFGLGTAWPPTWEGRYITTFSSLKTYNLNPVISVKVLDNLSLAAGFDVLWSKVRLKRKTPVVVRRRVFPDGEISIGGTGVGYGYNFGMLYEPLSGVKLGVSYRSQVSVTHYGAFTTNLPPPLPSVTSIAGSANLVYPASLTMGIACSRFKPLGFEFDTTWTGWSSYDKLKVKLDWPITVNGVATRTLSTPKGWHDAWAFRFGANWAIKEGMKVRVGYIYDLTPVPDTSFDPQVPDANRHIFTVGGDLKIWRFTLGLAYNYILSESRSKNNTIVTNGVPAALQVNGRYNSDVHSIGLNWAFQF
jgi:long-chain fatty acid transport protein